MKRLLIPILALVLTLPGCVDIDWDPVSPEVAAARLEAKTARQEAVALRDALKSYDDGTAWIEAELELMPEGDAKDAIESWYSAVKGKIESLAEQVAPVAEDVAAAVGEADDDIDAGLGAGEVIAGALLGSTPIAGWALWAIRLARRTRRELSIADEQADERSKNHREIVSSLRAQVDETLRDFAGLVRAIEKAKDKRASESQSSGDGAPKLVLDVNRLRTETAGRGSADLVEKIDRIRQKEMQFDYQGDPI